MPKSIVINVIAGLFFVFKHLQNHKGDVILMKGIAKAMLYPMCHISHELFKNVCLPIILNLG